MKNAGSVLGKSRLLNLVLDSLFKSGTLGALKYLHRNSLTILNYHRVDDCFQAGFETFMPNVSATPRMFARQMEYIKHNYNVITSEQLAAWLRNDFVLPQYPALITFDDGYHDNFVQAYPALQKYDLPAVIFLATGCIGKAIPFYWDYAAYCFYHSPKNMVRVSFNETLSWNDAVSRERSLLKWVNSVKFLPEEEKNQRVSSLCDELGVSIPADAFAGLYLDWDQVREMSLGNIEFGAHTVRHPILTRIPLSQVDVELAESKQKIEFEISRRVFSFAYPNGQLTDFSPEITNLVRKNGFDIAFTLLPGPIDISAVQKNPLTIRRIFLSHLDTLPRFVMKLIGVDSLSGLTGLIRRARL
jgi:peptidoglycan/xylan/chitin deacetylase (PgdA/CDA1 family)